MEWPVVLMGRIDEAFLDLPPEVLQTSMKEHQKFFSVKNPRTGRIERFVTVANVETADDGATILAGNQKVLAARLGDAKFFWENDLRIVREKGLEGMAAGLQGLSPSTTSWDHRPTALRASRRWRARSRRWWVPSPTWRRRPRACARPICNPRWSANSPNCRG